MYFEIKKAIEALRRPGIKTNPFRMVRRGIHYYLPATLPVPLPLTIYWSLNSVCNLHCKMCDVGTANEEGTFFKNLRIDKKLHEIDIAMFRRVVDEVAAAKPFMAFNSTEPLLYKPLGEAIEYCKSKGLETAVTTGAYSLPERAEELAKAGLQRLNVSIDGPPEVHNRMRGREDSFARAAAGITAFHDACRRRGYKPQIIIASTISNLNYTSLTALYDAIHGLPFDQLSFQYMWYISPQVAEEHNALWGDRYPVSTSCYGDYMAPDAVDPAVLASQIHALPRDARLHFSPAFNEEQLRCYFHEPHRFVNDSGRCMASWFFLQVLADGETIVYSRCHNKSLGNLNENSFSQIWNGEKMRLWRQFIRKVGKMPMCRRCDLVF